MEDRDGTDPPQGQTAGRPADQHGNSKKGGKKEKQRKGKKKKKKKKIGHRQTSRRKVRKHGACATRMRSTPSDEINKGTALHGRKSYYKSWSRAGEQK